MSTPARGALRPVEAHEADALAAMQVASWADAYRGIFPDAYLDGPMAEEKRAHWHRTLADPPAGSHVLVIADGTELLAFVAAYRSENPAYDVFIDNLHVRPDLRRGGFGRRLMAALAAEVVDAGDRSIFLTVVQENLRAVRFYQRVGGEIAGPDELVAHGGRFPLWVMAWRDLPALAALGREPPLAQNR